MSETGGTSNTGSTPVPTPATPSTNIRPQTLANTPSTTVLNPIRQSASTGGRLLNVPSSVSTPVNRGGILTPSGAGTNVGSSGGFVLRGGQLVRLPARGALTGESPLASGGLKSPVKVHLISAGGTVRPQFGGAIRPQGTPGTGRPVLGAQESSTDVKPKVQQYQIVLPTTQPQQVVVVNSAGVTSKQGRAVLPAGRSPAVGGRDGGQVVIYSGAPVGASATVGEGSPITNLQSLTLSGAPPGYKKNRSMGAPGSRKPCNCTKSQCLKLYCECFANGEFCRGCNCTNCHNNLAYENERSKSIKMCLERNPYAFQPKIGRKGRAETERLHNKGCNCKKSSCLKNYCECYEAKVPCTHRCKCVSCRNTEVDRIHKYRGAGGLQSLANAASLLSSAQSGESGRTDSPATEASYDKPDPKRMPWYYMTDDVVEATAQCLLTKAEQLETRGAIDDAECQREILKEFGRCLQQIIESAAD